MLYAGAKAFVSTLTRTGEGVGATKHPRQRAVAGGHRDPVPRALLDQEMLEAMRKTIPMERLGAPVDCTGTLLYLASDAMSGYVSGQIVEVNGGQLMP